MDALLVLGASAQFTMSVPSPAAYQQTAHRAERRRLKRLFGIETDPEVGVGALDRPQRLRDYRR